MFNIYNIVFTLEARYHLNCVKSTVKPQPTNEPCQSVHPVVCFSYLLY